jgi:hypothetical protein
MLGEVSRIDICGFDFYTFWHGLDFISEIVGRRQKTGEWAHG